MDEAQYEAAYAYDMKAQAAVEVCERAGVELVRSDKHGHWQWKWGAKVAHGPLNEAGLFETRDEAAIDFTQSSSFREWLRAQIA